MSVKDLLSQVRRPERTVELCLRGDLVAKHEEAVRKLEKAQVQDAEDDTFGGGGRALKEAANVKAIETEMNEALTTFWMRALPRMRSLDVLAEHPPRDGNDSDRAHGFNRDTYYQAMVQESTYQIVSPDGDTLAAVDLSDDDWTALVEALSFKQFDALVSAAVTVNDGDVAVPFSHLASLIYQNNEGDSKPQKPSASPRAGSRAGNPRRKRPTTTTVTADSPEA